MKQTLLITVLLGYMNMAYAEGWDNPLHPVGITTVAVAQKRRPILRVVHEEGYGGWQFYDDMEALDKPVVISKTELLKLDPSISSIKDLPVGWYATRKDIKSKWIRKIGTN